MALKDKIVFGMSLPHRSPDAIDPKTVGAVARRTELLGFADLWVNALVLGAFALAYLVAAQFTLQKQEP